MNFYVLESDNTTGGPFTAIQMMEMHRLHLITDDTPAAAAGDSSWQPFRDLLPLLRYEVTQPVPPPVRTLPDMEAQIAAALKSGPPTPHILEKLLKEDAQFAFPRPRSHAPAHPQRHRPPPPIILNPKLRRISLPG